MTVNEMMKHLRVLQARGAGEFPITFIQWNDEQGKLINESIENVACNFDENRQSGTVNFFANLKMEKA